MPKQLTPEEEEALERVARKYLSEILELSGPGEPLRDLVDRHVHESLLRRAVAPTPPTCAPDPGYPLPYTHFATHSFARELADTLVPLSVIATLDPDKAIHPGSGEPHLPDVNGAVHYDPDDRGEFSITVFPPFGMLYVGGVRSFNAPLDVIVTDVRLATDVNLLGGPVDASVFSVDGTDPLMPSPEKGYYPQDWGAFGRHVPLRIRCRPYGTRTAPVTLNWTLFCRRPPPPTHLGHDRPPGYPYPVSP